MALGISVPNIFDGMGMRTTKIRYGESQILQPSPLVSHQGVQSTGSISNSLNEGEQSDTLIVSITLESLKRLGDWQSAISPNQLWYANTNNTGWVKYRTFGEPRNTEGNAGIYQITLKSLGQGDY